jgi:hypothetical protein
MNNRPVEATVLRRHSHPIITNLSTRLHGATAKIIIDIFTGVRTSTVVFPYPSAGLLAY